MAVAPSLSDAALAELESQVQAGIEFHEGRRDDVCDGCLKLVALLEELTAEVDLSTSRSAGVVREGTR